jgi:small subunit ribosomal protein S2
VIPGNDDAIRAIQLYVQGASAAILEGRASAAHMAGGNGGEEFVEVSEDAS